MILAEKSKQGDAMVCFATRNEKCEVGQKQREQFNNSIKAPINAELHTYKST